MTWRQRCRSFRTGGLINIGNQNISMVQVLGYPPDIGQVSDWPATLHLNQKNGRKNFAGALAAPKLSDAGGSG